MVITYNFNNEEYDYEYEFDINDFIEYIRQDIKDVTKDIDTAISVIKELYDSQYLDIDSIEEEDSFKDFIKGRYYDKALQEYNDYKGNEEMAKDIARRERI